jgi:hypothetical protein
MAQIAKANRASRSAAIVTAHGIIQVKDPRAPVYPTNVAKTCSKCHATPRG